MVGSLRQPGAAFIAALLCAACASPGPGPAPSRAHSPQAVVDEILAADRAYAAASATMDVVSGLSAMFAADVAMQIPGARFSASADEAVAALRANPDNATSRIEWVPVRGGTSADGHHGYTWGYMTLHKPDGTTAPYKYLSYWVKQRDGWRVAAYKRRPRPAGEVSLAPVAASLPPRLVAVSTDAEAIERYRESLDATERAFSADAQVVGLGVAFARYGTADAVNMGGPQNAAFVVGSEAIGDVVSDGNPAEPSPLWWAPDRTLVATSGDLGVTIGLIRRNKPSADPNAPPGFPFFTVWRRASVSDPWRYIAE
jgi:hypothetical protein